MHILDVELDVKDLVEFIFQRNINNAILELSLGGIENTKDLFFFILDLFCKGLVLMYGNGENRVELQSLTQEQFAYMREKLECAGITPILEFLPNPDPSYDEDDQAIRYVNMNLADLQNEDDNKSLNEYVFQVYTPEAIYKLHFDLIHRSLA